jgi:flagella basal body P-ring formation protein FlgA
MKMYDKFFRKFGHLTVVCSALFLCSFPTDATSYTMADLSTNATKWLESQVLDSDLHRPKVQVYPLDQRLANKTCDQVLEYSLVSAQLQRQNTVKIQCPGKSGWQMFVSAKVSQFVPAVAVTRQLAAGSYLTSEMLNQTETDLLQSRGALVSEAKLVIGARTKKALNVGQILTQNDLCLVCKGDVVTIVGVSNGLSVTTQATALQDGTLGDDVKVQNLQSKRVLTAQITAVKRVEIKL